MACPFFSPTERADDLALPHPARLPLGAAWRGMCTSPGYEAHLPSNQELESCNLGYAKLCPRLPKQRSCDAVRFGVMRDSGTALTLQYVLETGHQPAGHGMLQYDYSLGNWTARHPEPRIQKMAECFLGEYLKQTGG